MLDATTIQRARLGDWNAHTAVIDEYRQRATRYAESTARRIPSVNAADFESSLLWTVHKCLESYDPAMGDFDHLVNSAWFTARKNELKRAADEWRRGQTQSLDALVDVADDSTRALADNSADPADVVTRSVAVQTVIADVARRDETLGRVVAMIARGGFTHVQIARACGYEGSDAGAKMWVKRRIEQLRGVVDKEALQA